MDSKWVLNGLQMGSKWDQNEIQMFQLQQKFTYSRSYLVVVVVTSICYKWLKKLLLQQKVNILQLGSKWAPNVPIATKSYLFQELLNCDACDVNTLQMSSKWARKRARKWAPNVPMATEVPMATKVPMATMFQWQQSSNGNKVSMATKF